MIKYTFCHLPGIGAIKEKGIWESGFRTWDDVIRETGAKTSKADKIKAQIALSHQELVNRNPEYFFNSLPSSQTWRLLPEFRNSAVYLDIETTGLEPSYDHITTIACYDGRDIFHYVNGRNLDDFKDDIKKYNLLITYNGKTFDAPFIEKKLGVTLPQSHLDLRYLLKSLGYAGGLKSCEKQLGYDRGKLANVDGYMAVLLWHEYKKSRDPKVLDTLLAYNVEDVLTLENLAVFAYNQKLKQTPFYKILRLPAPVQPENPFQADVRLIDRLKSKSFFGSFNL